MDERAYEGHSDQPPVARGMSMLREALFIMLPRAIKLRYIHVRLPVIRGLAVDESDELFEKVRESNTVPAVPRHSLTTSQATRAEAQLASDAR